MYQEYKMNENSVQTFNIGHKICVKVFCGDISKAAVSAVIVEDDEKNCEETKQVLKKVCPQLTTIEKEKTSCEDVTISRVDGIRKISFKNICHVHVNKYSADDQQTWVVKMEEIYKNIFEIAEKRNFRTMAMAVLLGGAPVDVAAGVVVRSIAEYKPRQTYMTEFNIISQHKEVTTEIISLCQNYFKSEKCRDSSLGTAQKTPTHETDQKKSTLQRTNAKHGTKNLKNKVCKETSLATTVKGQKLAIHAAGMKHTSEKVNKPVKNQKEDDKKKILFQTNDKMKRTQPHCVVGADAVTENEAAVAEEAIKNEDILKKSEAGTVEEEEEPRNKNEEEKKKEEEKEEKIKEEKKKEEEKEQKIKEEEQKNEEKEEITCVICMDTADNPKKLDKCGHIFCTECIDKCFQNFKPICPSCGTVYGVIVGDQPPGTMDVSNTTDHLPGYENYNTIVIHYRFENGIQNKDHPHPGAVYHGTYRTAYLPDCPEGQKVCRLLQKAFDRKLTFTVGRSATTGMDDCVIWNDIHHKTNPHGGAQGFGYPDPTYLTRVQEELASKGVTEDS